MALNPLGMFKNYFQIGWRNLLRSKVHSFVNIFGLAAGIASCFLITLYITDELSYDRHHENAEHISRVVAEGWAKMPPAVAPGLQTTYPHQIKEAVRLWPLFSPAKMRQGDVVFVESSVVFADANVFSVFTWPMTSGNPSKALADKNTIVLTQSMAKKYFGTNDPVGKSVKFWGNDLTVTGVIKDLPANSHLCFDFLISLSTLQMIMGNIDENWEMPAFYTYVWRQENTSPAELETSLHKLFSSHAANAEPTFQLQPLTSIHLHSQLEGEFAPGGNITYLYALGTAAVFILILACINFINLTTAKATIRTKEIGMRKVMGAWKRQLIEQFFGEALVTTGTAVVIALFLISLALPAFNVLTGKTLDFQQLLKPEFLLALFATAMVIGFAAGAYPALYLSRILPATAMKGTTRQTSGLWLRKGLIIFQFMVSAFFLAGMTVVLLQVSYLQNKDLGFDKDHVIVLDGDRFPQMRDALRSVSGVEHVAGVPSVLGGPLPRSFYRAEHSVDSTRQMVSYGTTPELIETMNMQLLAGRSFKDGASNDADAFVLNESAVHELGWQKTEEALDKDFEMFIPPLQGGAEVWRKGKIVGVVKDFNHDALYKKTEPLALFVSEDLNLTLVKVHEFTPQVISNIEKTWKKINADAPFNYYLLDDRLKQQYEGEWKLGTIMSTATVLAIIIACLGLLSLVTFSASQRTKEIGIRKVVGASVGQIVALLSGDLIKLVAIASLLAMPVAYFVMNQWLDSFAYHIELSWSIFVITCFAMLVLALLTVSVQSFKAASADPTESLRSE